MDSFPFRDWLEENTLSTSAIEPSLAEVATWDAFDANARVGRSGVHGWLALEAPQLIAEMDRFGIRQALVSHFAAEEYDAAEGNRELAHDTGRYSSRLVAAWAALPDANSIALLSKRRPAAVRLFTGVHQHNFSVARWCAGELFEYLEAEAVLTLIEARSAGWEAFNSVLENFPRLKMLLLEPGYRADRHLFPLLKRFEHLYFDSSTYVAHRQLEAFVNKFGPERIVFGSQLPLYTPGAALAVLASARIPDDARLAIAGGTLRRLLNAEDR